MKMNSYRCSQCSHDVAKNGYIGLALCCIDLWRKNIGVASVATFLIGIDASMGLKTSLYAISGYIGYTDQKQRKSSAKIGKTDVASKWLHRGYIDQEVANV